MVSQYLYKDQLVLMVQSLRVERSLTKKISNDPCVNGEITLHIGFVQLFRIKFAGKTCIKKCIRVFQ